MRLRDILLRGAILENLKGSDKVGILQEFSELAEKLDAKLKRDLIFQILASREKLGSTGVGSGVAIPHGKVPELDHIVAIFGRSKKGIDFESHDQKATHLFFVLLAPESAIGNHLQALARLSRLLKDPRVREKLVQCPRDELYELLLVEDEKL